VAVALIFKNHFVLALALLLIMLAPHFTPRCWIFPELPPREESFTIRARCFPENFPDVNSAVLNNASVV